MSMPKDDYRFTWLRVLEARLSVAIYGFVHGSDYKAINPLREVETLLAAMIGKWINHLEEQRSMLKMSNNDTEPGAVATGSNAQVDWSHPLATAHGSVPSSVVRFTDSLVNLK